MKTGQSMGIYLHRYNLYLFHLSLYFVDKNDNLTPQSTHCVCYNLSINSHLFIIITHNSYL